MSVGLASVHAKHWHIIHWWVTSQRATAGGQPALGAAQYNCNGAEDVQSSRYTKINLIE